MRQKKGFFLLSINLICFVPLFQFFSFGKIGFTGSFNIEFVSPQGDFKQNLDKSIIAPGISFSFGIKPCKLPFYIGVQGEYLLYGSDSRNETLYIAEFGDVDLTVRHRYTKFSGFVFLRFLPIKRRRLHFYIDGLLGFSNYNTSSSIPAAPATYDCSYEDENNSFVRTSHFNDTVLCYGAGTGFLIKIGKELRNRKNEHFINIGVQYTYSPKTEYYKKGSIVVEGQEAIFYKYESTISLITFQVGYTATF